MHFVSKVREIVAKPSRLQVRAWRGDLPAGIERPLRFAVDDSIRGSGSVGGGALRCRGSFALASKSGQAPALLTITFRAQART